MKTIISAIVFILFTQASFAQDQVRIFGKVTDFNGNPIDSVNIRLKDKNFKNVYETFTTEDGTFSMYVNKGNYLCLYALKASDWIKRKLEYWAWNFPAFQDIEINPQYDRMEIYGVNVFEPQLGPYETYMVYFRPMSLQKIHKVLDDNHVTEVSKLKLVKGDTLHIAPKDISKEELDIRVNDQSAKILGIHQAIEYVRGNYEHTYLVQIMKPEKNKESIPGYDKISVVLRSKETNESGKAEYFLKKTL